MVWRWRLAVQKRSCNTWLFLRDLEGDSWSIDEMFNSDYLFLSVSEWQYLIGRCLFCSDLNEMAVQCFILDAATLGIAFRLHFASCRDLINYDIANIESFQRNIAGRAGHFQTKCKHRLDHDPQLARSNRCLLLHLQCGSEIRRKWEQSVEGRRGCEASLTLCTSGDRAVGG